jgi:hypothetical protein
MGGRAASAARPEHAKEVGAVKKSMTNVLSVIALPFIAPTVGAYQGTTAPSAARGTGNLPGLGGTGLRLRKRDLWVAPDSLPGGPVI